PTRRAWLAQPRVLLARSEPSSLIELGEYCVGIDEIARVGLCERALERMSKRDALLWRQVISRRVVEVDGDLGALREVDGLVHDDSAVLDVCLERGHRHEYSVRSGGSGRADGCRRARWRCAGARRSARRGLAAGRSRGSRAGSTWRA